MTRLRPNRTVLVSFALLFTLSQTACLKTRAQLKEEGGEDTSAPSAPVQSKVTDVQPQGQYAFDEMKSEFTRLEGRVEDIERTQKQGATDPAAKEEQKKIEQRIVELERAQANMLEAIKKLQESPAAAASADPSEFIDRAKNQIEEGNFSGAVDNLNVALKTAKGKKAEEATFLRGEAYYSLKDYKKAIVDFSKFPEKYTRSSYMPKALYKIGQSFDALGMKEDGQSFYHELLDKYPKSPEAKKARAKVK